MDQHGCAVETHFFLGETEPSHEVVQPLYSCPKFLIIYLE